MAVNEKFYSVSPEVLKNVICDIAEMRKAKIRRLAENRLEMVTTMYNIETAFRFRWMRSDTGTLLTIEADGENEGVKQDVAYMFTMLNGMINPLIKKFGGNTIN